MAYELTFDLALGSGQTGIADLRAQLVDDTGSNVGSAVSSGFTEIGNGYYIWNYTSIPDAHRGAVKFYSAAASSTFLAVAAINPEEGEYTNAKTSTRSSHSAADVWTSGTRTLTSFGTLAADVWAVATSTLTTSGTIGKLLVDNINATISSRSSHTAAAVWSVSTRTLSSFDTLIDDIWAELTSGITTSGSIGKLIITKLNLLTGPVAQATTETADITITQYVTLDGLSIPDITVPGTWTKCYFTVKRDRRNETDAQSLIQLVVSNPGAGGDGLLYLNGSAATASDGILAVGVDSVTITLHDDATAELEDCQDLNFDIKFLKSDGKSTQARVGTVDIDLATTRTI